MFERLVLEHVDDEIDRCNVTNLGIKHLNLFVNSPKYSNGVRSKKIALAGAAFYLSLKQTQVLNPRQGDLLPMLKEIGVIVRDVNAIGRCCARMKKVCS